MNDAKLTVEAERAACEHLARTYRAMRLCDLDEAETQEEREMHAAAALAALRIADAIAERKDQPPDPRDALSARIETLRNRVDRAVETERAVCELEAQRVVPQEPIDPNRSGDYLRGRRDAALAIRDAICARKQKREEQP